MIDAAPANVVWHRVRPREGGPLVRAWSTARDQEVETEHGVLHARAGLDVIVEHMAGEYGVVRRDIFDRLYISVGGDLYRKRTDIVLRYFTMRRPVLVKTLEGAQEAAAGDWIMEGPMGELWPVERAEAQRKYVPA